MKLGVSFNVWDGEELLEGAINQIRSEVDYISVVYQTLSNFGQPCNLGLVPLLNKLKLEGKIDEMILYKPKDLEGFNNEVAKRNLGLEFSRNNKCTHHMSMDTDEYYLLDEFKYMKNKVEESDADAAYCQMQTYYKSWEYSLDPPEEYYVATIYKIKENNQFIFSYPCSVLVDPTRRMSKITNPLVLKREEVQMHHGSYIRNNIMTKLLNSSSRQAFIQDIQKIAKQFRAWKYPEKIYWGGQSKQLTVKQVKNLFE